MKYAVAISVSLVGKPISNKVFLVEGQNQVEAVAEAITDDHTFYTSQYSAEDWPNRRKIFKSGLYKLWNGASLERIIEYYQKKKRFISKPVRI